MVKVKVQGIERRAGEIPDYVIPERTSEPDK